MSAQHMNDAGGHADDGMSSAAAGGDGQRKRAREQCEVQQAGDAQQPLFVSPAGASEDSSDVDERAFKQAKLDNADAAASHAAPSMAVAKMAAASTASSSLPSSVASSSAPSFARPSAMLRCLTFCRDMQFSIMQMLELKDLAQLDAICRSWRAWLLHPPHLSSLDFNMKGQWLRPQPTVGVWLPQLVTSVEQGALKLAGEWQPRFCHGSLEDQLEQCKLMMHMLPRYSRLRKLALHIFEVPQASLDTCFGDLAGSLRELSFTTMDEDALLLSSLFQSLHPLRALETLQVFGQAISHGLDFSALPKMSHLRTFTLTGIRTDLVEIWRCNRAQVHHLAQCYSLTSFKCSSWSPDERTQDVDGTPLHLPSADQQVADGIGALVSGWLNSSSSSASAASSVAVGGSSDVAPSRVKIQRLHLSLTRMTAAVWDHVSRLTSLTELHPGRWSLDFTEDDWARLAEFSQLHRLVIYPVPPGGSWLRSEHIVPPLLSCVQLNSLCLSRMRFSSDQLRAICAGLSLLARLFLLDVHLEDCTPLTLALALRVLQLSGCMGAAGVVTQFRSALPPMPLLTSLSIHEDRAHRITAVQAAPLNAALYARMPRLTPDNFSQFLLPAEPAAAPAPVEPAAAAVAIPPA